MIEMKEAIFEVLKDYGMTEKEMEVYLYLTKRGVQRAHDISTGIGMHKAQVYQILKKLQSLGVVETTMETPMRFTAIPFEKFLELNLKTKREELNSLEGKKSELLDYWESMNIQPPQLPLQKFMVIEGRNKIASKIYSMIEGAESEILAIITSSALVQAYRREVIGAMIKRNIPFRVLIPVTEDNYKLLKQVTERVSKVRSIDRSPIDIEGRHINLISKISPRFFMVDGKEGLFYIAPKDDSEFSSGEEIALWLNSPAVVFARLFFEEIWRNAIPISKKIHEFETGETPEETILIKDPKSAFEKFANKIDTAQNKIIVTTSLKGLNRILDNLPIPELHARGVKIRIMAPINETNLTEAEKLSNYSQIKHVNDNYLRIAIIDEKHLFLTKGPPLDDETTNKLAYFDNMFYTNDQEYIQRMKEMLNETWERSSSPTD